VHPLAKATQTSQQRSKKVLNALTIDLEDWYQGLTSTSQRVDRWPSYENRVVESTNRLLDILAQAGVKATFFVLGYVADQFPELICQVADAGHEIGLHSYYHQQVCRLTPDQFHADVVRGREAVEKASGRQVIGYRAPMFSINRSALWALDILREMGFRYDSSVFPIRSVLYSYPKALRFPHRLGDGNGLVEFPISTACFGGINWPIGGGFYLRISPYTIIRLGIRQLNRQGQPAIMYMHPWELDTGQNYGQVTLRERVTHYYGRRRLKKKIARLFADFDFTSLCNMLDLEHTYQSLSLDCFA
jgi:polysaccharide deacetylase family protein (PEP-CTERM system associated)